MIITKEERGVRRPRLYLPIHTHTQISTRTNRETVHMFAAFTTRKTQINMISKKTEKQCKTH